MQSWLRRDVQLVVLVWVHLVELVVALVGFLDQVGTPPSLVVWALKILQAQAPRAGMGQVAVVVVAVYLVHLLACLLQWVSAVTRLVLPRVLPLPLQLAVHLPQLVVLVVQLALLLHPHLALQVRFAPSSLVLVQISQLHSQLLLRDSLSLPSFPQRLRQLQLPRNLRNVPPQPQLLQLAVVLVAMPQVRMQRQVQVLELVVLVELQVLLVVWVLL
jgi:hypothetical protein